MKQNLVGLTFYVEDDGLLAAMISQGDHRAIGRQRGSPYVGARRVARDQGRADLKHLFVPLAMEQDFPAVNPISGGGDQASLIGMEDRGYSVRRRWQRQLASFLPTSEIPKPDTIFMPGDQQTAIGTEFHAPRSFAHFQRGG